MPIRYTSIDAFEYENLLFNYLKAAEGERYSLYDDGEGVITSGIGFNWTFAKSGGGCEQW